METRVINIRSALDVLGVSWCFGGPVEDGTEECWNDVSWEDSRTKPTWSELVAANESAAIDAAIQSVNSSFAVDENALLDSIGRTILSDGATESDALAALRIAWENLQDAKQAAIIAALGV